MIAHNESVHEGQKPFLCDICDYIFSNKSNLLAHIESVHEGQKLFKSDILWLHIYSLEPLKNEHVYILVMCRVLVLAIIYLKIYEKDGRWEGDELTKIRLFLEIEKNVADIVLHLLIKI